MANGYAHNGLKKFNDQIGYNNNIPASREIIHNLVTSCAYFGVHVQNNIPCNKTIGVYIRVARIVKVPEIFRNRLFLLERNKF